MQLHSVNLPTVLMNHLQLSVVGVLNLSRHIFFIDHMCFMFDQEVFYEPAHSYHISD